MSKRVTQRDIAKKAGVDVSTVCLSLNGHPRISEPTRANVLRMAKELGYRPDPALSAIASARWSQPTGDAGKVLAFVADDFQHAEIELRLVYDGVRAQAENLGYRAEPLSLKEYPSATSLRRVIRARGIRGIVVGQSRQDLPPSLFDESDVPVVHCGYLRDVPGDVVRPDLRSATANLIEHLSEDGLRVGCFLPIEPELRSDRVILGAALATARMLPRGRVKVMEVLPTFGSGVLDRFRHSEPDRIITLNEKFAARLVKEGGFIPKDIYTLHTLPPFQNKQGMDLRLPDVGRAGVNLLELKLRHQPLADEPFRQTLLVVPQPVSAYPNTERACASR